MPEAAGRGLVLVGLPGSGKNAVGRLVAERLGRPFIDTDALCERLAGEPVPDYLRRHGEPAFRELERRAIEAACREPEAVIAAGGGAVLDPLNRWDLWSHGPVAWLKADPALLLRRLAADDVPRPLLEPDPPTRLRQLADDRSPYYRAADLHLAAGPPARTVATDLIERLESVSGQWPPAGRRLFDAETPRHHPIGAPLARVIIGYGLDRHAMDAAFEVVRHPNPSLVIDRRVIPRLPQLIAALPAGRCLAIVAGERAKRLRRLERLLEWLADGPTERGAPLIAVGGGTLGDLAGMAAALYARGLPMVQVPTTWLAQADSAIGGKVAVDLRAAKNAAGAFWPPAAVIADTAALEALPVARRRDGMAESVKAALIGDAALWRLIVERGRSALRRDAAARYAIVERAARVKLAVCARDPFEAGERRTLNLGHTVGHALEVESRYRLPHGTAVGLGLRAVASIAAGRGGDADLGHGLDDMLRTLGFPLRHAFDPSVVRDALASDKKRLRGRQRWILPLGIGEVAEVDDVSDGELERALRAIAT